MAGCASNAGPGALAARAAAGTEAYVCTFAYVSQPGLTVTPIDLTSGRTDPRVATGSLPSSMAATPDGRLLLVTNQGGNTVSVVDTASDGVVGKLPTGLEPDAVAVSPDGAWALVANLDDDTVTPIDLHTMRTRPPVHVGRRPDAVAVGGANGRTALVADSGDGSVTIVDLATMTAEPAVPVGNDPVAVAIQPGTSTGMVADYTDGSVRSIQLTTRNVSSAVSVGPGPTGLVMARRAGSIHQGARAWVSVGSTLEGVDLTTMSVVTTHPVGHVAGGLALDHSGTVAWVAGQDGTVTSVDLTSGRTGPPIFVGGKPSAIVVPPPRG